MSISDIAFTLSKPIAETLTILEDPEFVALLEHFTRAHEARAALLARWGMEAATRTFTRLSEFIDHPETARKSAGALVRILADSKPKPISPETRLKAAAALLNSSIPGATGPGAPGSASAPRSPNSRSRAAPSTPTPDAPVSSREAVPVAKPGVVSQFEMWHALSRA